MTYEQKLKVVIVLLYNRRYGFLKPTGKIYYNRWKPAKSEVRDCCRKAKNHIDYDIYGDLYEHCKSIEHCSNLIGAKPKDALIYLQRIIKDKTFKPHQHVLSVDEILSGIPLPGIKLL